MSPLRFLKVFIHTNIILQLIINSGVTCVGLKFRMPVSTDNFDAEESEDIDKFNFPKESVFVFNRPTIINLGDIDNVDVIENLGGDDNLHTIANDRKHRLLCRIIKVSDDHILSFERKIISRNIYVSAF